MPIRIFPSKADVPQEPAAAKLQAQEQKGLEIQVVFTGMPALKAALAAAAGYARLLDAHFTVIATHVVPYPLPLCRPPSATVLEQNLAAIAAEQNNGTSVQIYICRDPQQTIREVLQPDAATVIAGRRRWWRRTREQRLASRLRRDGHSVMFLDIEA